jgi:hypothetical protein
LQHLKKYSNSERLEKKGLAEEIPKKAMETKHKKFQIQRQKGNESQALHKPVKKHT